MIETYLVRIIVDIHINPSPSNLHFMFLILHVLFLFVIKCNLFILSYSITMMIEIYSDKNTYVDIHINPSPSELFR